MANNRTYVDDNFGSWDIESDDEESLEWYREVQRQSITKTCACCGRQVRLRPDYDKCDSCATILEQGGDPYC